jgi:hypothetical protein
MSIFEANSRSTVGALSSQVERWTTPTAGAAPDLDAVRP